VRDLIGKFVVVETAETMYTGKLIEVGEEEVYLESETGWVVIPVDRVASIRERD
jgi:ribosome maturation factor RimP